MKQLCLLVLVSLALAAAARAQVVVGPVPDPTQTICTKTTTQWAGTFEGDSVYLTTYRTFVDGTLSAVSRTLSVAGSWAEKWGLLRARVLLDLAREVADFWGRSRRRDCYEQPSFPPPHGGKG